MTLENLLAIRRLHRHEAGRVAIEKLLKAAERNLADARVSAIQALPLTLGVAPTTVIVLDALRKQRNLNDYTGDGVSAALLAECLSQAGRRCRPA